VVLEWTSLANAAGDAVELERVTTALPADASSVPANTSNIPAAAPAVSAGRHGRTAGAGQTRAASDVRGLLGPAKEPAAVRLRVGGDDGANAGGAGADPGGTIDRSVEVGRTYRYIAWRVKTAVAGTHRLELRSVPTAAISVEVKDTFPPDAPNGLVAAPGIAANPAASQAIAIDLSWEPAAELRIAGYRVYRRELLSESGAAGEWRRIGGADLLTAAAYRDSEVTAGRRYAYRVTAVGEAGLESAPSNVVEETAPAP
jgi:hypothetical protein